MVFNPAEARFDMAAWTAANATVIERSGVEWVCLCPACGREKLAVNVAKKAFQCWRCGIAGRRPKEWVSLILQIPMEPDAVEVVAAAGAQGLGPVAELEVREPARTGPYPPAPLPPGLSPLDAEGAAYLQARGVAWSHAAAFGALSCHGDQTGSIAGRVMRHRVVLPVWDARGVVVFWTARATRDDPMKLANLPRPCKDPAHGPTCACNHVRWGLAPTPGCAGKAAVLGGLHLVRPGDRVIVVEGPMDALVVGPGTVPAFGARLSYDQVALLVAAGVSEVVVLFDGDDPGYRGLWGRDRGRRPHPGAYPGAAALVATAIPTRAAVCPPGTDPGSLGRDAVLRLADAAPWAAQRDIRGLGRPG